MKLLFAIVLVAIAGFTWGTLMGMAFSQPLSLILSVIGGGIIGYFLFPRIMG